DAAQPELIPERGSEWRRVVRRELIAGHIEVDRADNRREPPAERFTARGAERAPNVDRRARARALRVAEAARQAEARSRVARIDQHGRIRVAVHVVAR